MLCSYKFCFVNHKPSDYDYMISRLAHSKIEDKMKEKILFQASKNSRLTDSMANTYGHRIMELMHKKKSKEIKPDDILEDPQFHDYFTWDDTEAAHKHRLNEARELLRSIVIQRVVIEENEPKSITVRQFHNVQISKTSTRGYVSFETIEKSPELALQVLNQAKAGLSQWAQKHKHLKALLPIVNEIEKFLSISDI